MSKNVQKNSLTKNAELKDSSTRKDYPHHSNGKVIFQGEKGNSLKLSSIKGTVKKDIEKWIPYHTLSSNPDFDVIEFFGINLTYNEELVYRAIMHLRYRDSRNCGENLHQITIKLAELYELCGWTDKRGKASGWHKKRLQEIIDNRLHKSFSRASYIKDKIKANIVILPTVTWDDNGRYLYVSINPDLIPPMNNKGNFVQSEFYFQSFSDFKNLIDACDSKKDKKTLCAAVYRHVETQFRKDRKGNENEHEIKESTLINKCFLRNAKKHYHLLRLPSFDECFDLMQQVGILKSWRKQVLPDNDFKYYFVREQIEEITLINSEEDIKQLADSNSPQS